MRKIALRDGTSMSLVKLEEMIAREAGLYIWKCSCGSLFLTLEYSIYHVEKKHPGDTIQDRIQVADDLQFERNKWDELYEAITELIVGPNDPALEKETVSQIKEIPDVNTSVVQNEADPKIEGIKDICPKEQKSNEIQKTTEKPVDSKLEDDLEDGEIGDDEDAEIGVTLADDTNSVSSWPPARFQQHTFAVPHPIPTTGPVITDDPTPLLSLNISKPDKILTPRKRKNKKYKRGGQKKTKMLISECEEETEFISNPYFYEDAQDFEESYKEDTLYDRVMSPRSYQAYQPVCQKVCKKRRKRLVMVEYSY